MRFGEALIKKNTKRHTYGWRALPILSSSKRTNSRLFALRYSALAWICSYKSLGTAAAAAAAASSATRRWLPSFVRSSASWFLVGVVACLSTPVVRNMASKNQAMNRAFEPFRIVNTYGAFGSVSKVRVYNLAQAWRLDRSPCCDDASLTNNDQSRGEWGATLALFN